MPPIVKCFIQVALIVCVFDALLVISGLKLDWIWASSVYGDGYKSLSLKGSNQVVEVACLSDSHGNHDLVNVPDADVVIFTGDATNPHSEIPTKDQLKLFLEWFRKLPHSHKIFVAGNHDVDETFSLASLKELIHTQTYGSVIYLQDEAVSIKIPEKMTQINIFGSPWQPQFPGSETFKNNSGFLMETFGKASDLLTMTVKEVSFQNINVIATHTPPLMQQDNFYGNHVGSKDLLAAIELLQKQLKASDSPTSLINCFGHIHVGREIKEDVQISIKENSDVTFVNSALVDDSLKLQWEPVVLRISG